MELQESINNKNLKAIHDTMDVLSGKWKILIIASLCYYEKRRYSELLTDINGISSKMLSKELRELQNYSLVRRKVLDTHPVTVQYELTVYGKTLKTITDRFADWGILFSNDIAGNDDIKR